MKTKAKINANTIQPQPQVHTLFPHQERAVKEAQILLDKYGFVYIQGQPRVGKSLIAHTLAPNALVVTKKNAINDWLKYTQKVINYEQISKYNPRDYDDIVIIDEAHNLGCRGKASKRVKELRTFCYNKRVIFLSGTPYIETPLSIYHQLYVTKYSPFNHLKNFYEFFRAFGIPSPIHIYGRNIESYAKHKDALIPIIDTHAIKVTYEDAGFKYQNYDKRIEVPATEAYRMSYKKIINEGVVANETINNVAMALHQYEGGFWNDNRKFRNAPKVDWLWQFVNDNLNKHKNDTNFKIAIMAYFKAEQVNIARAFKEYPNVVVLSAYKYCEGVDLSDYSMYILYSFGYSGAKFVQLRDRIVNLNKDKRTEVLIPLIKDSICEAVYASVSKKRNFNKATFNQNLQNNKLSKVVI